MKKIIGLFISRGFIVGLSIALQAGFWMLVFTVFEEYSNLLTGIMVLISFFCVLYIIIKDIYPEHKIAWIIFMFTFPIAGGMIYLLFGKHRVSKKTQKFYNQVEQNLMKSCKGVKEPDLSILKVDHAFRQLNYLKNIAKAPAFEHTSVAYFSLGEEMLAAMVEELKKAEKFIFIESFIIEEGKMWGAIESILIEKAQKGVDVRILYDDMGCLLTLPLNFSKRLKAQGIDCRVFNKITHVINANFNNRDHRKICVIDGNVGFNGGINLADEYINQKVIFGHWKDTAVMLKGEAVYGLTTMFLSMWELQTGKIEDYSFYAPTRSESSDGIIQPFSDNPLDDDSVGESIYMSILNTAKDYVYITSPYLIITREMIVSLINAAKSGVDVRLILPGIPDKRFVQFLSRSYYTSLVKAGVKIYEYTPGFIHSKMFIADDNTAIVGTINLDYRSLDLHFECATMMYECSVIKNIKEDFLLTLEKSDEITDQVIQENNKFGIFKFIALGVLRTFSPLM